MGLGGGGGVSLRVSGLGVGCPLLLLGFQAITMSGLPQGSCKSAQGILQPMGHPGPGELTVLQRGWHREAETPTAKAQSWHC